MQAIPVPVGPPGSSVVRQSQVNIPRSSSIARPSKVEAIERATSPIDERILEEFYNDQPKDMHAYNLEGRRYIVYEGKQHAEDIESYRKGTHSSKRCFSRCHVWYS